MKRGRRNHQSRRPPPLPRRERTEVRVLPSLTRDRRSRADGNPSPSRHSPRWAFPGAQCGMGGGVLLLPRRQRACPVLDTGTEVRVLLSRGFRGILFQTVPQQPHLVAEGPDFGTRPGAPAKHIRIEARRIRTEMRLAHGGCERGVHIARIARAFAPVNNRPSFPCRREPRAGRVAGSPRSLRRETPLCYNHPATQNDPGRYNQGRSHITRVLPVGQNRVSDTRSAGHTPSIAVRLRYPPSATRLLSQRGCPRVKG